MKKWMLLFVYFFALSAQAEVKVGELAYDDIGKDAAGNPVTISQYKGKVVIVTFWATWCTYCMKEIPVLESIQKQAGQDKLQVIAVSHKEDLGTFKAVSKKLSDAQTQLVFDKGRSAKNYGVGGIPHMVMIDKEGKVVSVHVGYAEEEVPALVAEINQLLRQ